MSHLLFFASPRSSSSSPLSSLDWLDRRLRVLEQSAAQQRGKRSTRKGHESRRKEQSHPSPSFSSTLQPRRHPLPAQQAWAYTTTLPPPSFPLTSPVAYRLDRAQRSFSSLVADDGPSLPDSSLSLLSALDGAIDSVKKEREREQRRQEKERIIQRIIEEKRAILDQHQRQWREEQKTRRATTDGPCDTAQHWAERTEHAALHQQQRRDMKRSTLELHRTLIDQERSDEVEWEMLRCAREVEMECQRQAQAMNDTRDRRRRVEEAIQHIRITTTPPAPALPLTPSLSKRPSIQRLNSASRPTTDEQSSPSPPPDVLSRVSPSPPPRSSLTSSSSLELAQASMSVPSSSTMAPALSPAAVEVMEEDQRPSFTHPLYSTRPPLPSSPIQSAGEDEVEDDEAVVDEVDGGGSAALLIRAGDGCRPSFPSTQSLQRSSGSVKGDQASLIQQQREAEQEMARLAERERERERQEEQERERERESERERERERARAAAAEERERERERQEAARRVQADREERTRMEEREKERERQRIAEREREMEEQQLQQRALQSTILAPPPAPVASGGVDVVHSLQSQGQVSVSVADASPAPKAKSTFGFLSTMFKRGGAGAGGGNTEKGKEPAPVAQKGHSPQPHSAPQTKAGRGVEAVVAGVGDGDDDEEDGSSGSDSDVDRPAPSPVPSSFSSSLLRHSASSHSSSSIVRTPSTASAGVAAAASRTAPLPSSLSSSSLLTSHSPLPSLASSHSMGGGLIRKPLPLNNNNKRPVRGVRRTHTTNTTPTRHHPTTTANPPHPFSLYALVCRSL